MTPFLTNIPLFETQINLQSLVLNCTSCEACMHRHNPMRRNTHCVQHLHCLKIDASDNALIFLQKRKRCQLLMLMLMVDTD